MVITNDDYGYGNMMVDLQTFVNIYPIVTSVTIGYSVLGREIPAIFVGGGGIKRLHINASFHANEWITTLLLMKFIEDYAIAYHSGQQLRGRNIQQLAERVAIWTVPMVNPDGVELVLDGISPLNPYYERVLMWNNWSQQFDQWKANIRGVDLNDQFPAHWEVERDRRAVDGPGPRDYVGTAPLTEPEAIMMAQFTNNSDFSMVIALHTQGQEIYWNYRNMEPPESVEIARRLGEVSGYIPVELTDSDAGYKDWFIQQFRRPGFTVEAGIGINPLPVSQFDEIYDDVLPLLLEAVEIVAE